MTNKQQIAGLTAEDRERIRDAVHLAMELWPNAHLGEHSRLEDMRSAFRRLRNWMAVTDLHHAIVELEMDAYRHEDM